MKRLRLTPLFSIGLCLLMAAGALAQSGSFSDPNVEYTFDLPDDRWKMTAKPSTTSPNVEYVFIDRRDGHLEVRKNTVGQDDLLTDIIRSEEQKLQFLPGYVTGKEENFNGKYRGSAFNFEFVRAGRNMAGRFYFLRANPTTVYVLRFTAERDKLKSIRNQTDSIARTFSLKGA